MLDTGVCVWHSNTLAAVWTPDTKHSLQQRVPWYILSDRLSSILSDFVESELLTDSTFGWCGWRMESVMTADTVTTWIQESHVCTFDL